MSPVSITFTCAFVRPFLDQLTIRHTSSRIRIYIQHNHIYIPPRYGWILFRSKTKQPAPIFCCRHTCPWTYYHLHPTSEQTSGDIPSYRNLLPILLHAISQVFHYPFPIRFPLFSYPKHRSLYSLFILYSLYHILRSYPICITYLSSCLCSTPWSYLVSSYVTPARFIPRSTFCIRTGISISPSSVVYVLHYLLTCIRLGWRNQRKLSPRAETALSYLLQNRDNV